MPFAAKGPPPGQEDGPLESSLLAGADVQANYPIQAPAQAILRNLGAVREAKFHLLREGIHEAVGFIRLHGEAAQALAEAADDAGLIHSIGRIVVYAKHIARLGNELRDLRMEAR